MKDAPNVAEKACGALYFLAQGYEDVGSTSPLTPYFQEIVQSLLNVTHREDAGESRLRTAAYETLNEVVRCSTEETARLVLELVQVIMAELHKTLEAQKLSSDEREKQNELQGLLCGCLQVIIQKLGASEPTKYAFMQYADQIMNLFLRVFACRSATVHEEAMLAIGALAYATGPNFAKYMPDFYKYLEMGLQNFEEYQVCAVTVGVVGDICRALEDKILPYCDGIMTQLLKDLSSNQLHRSVKPPIFSCFGDIALAIGENFEKYLMYAMPMLQSAAELSAHTSGADDEMIEYTNLLRNGILEAYSGIFQGFKNSPKTQLLIPYAPHILQFLDSIYMEKDMLSDCGLLAGMMLMKNCYWRPWRPSRYSGKLDISRVMSGHCHFQTTEAFFLLVVTNSCISISIMGLGSFFCHGVVEVGRGVVGYVVASRYFSGGLRSESVIFGDRLRRAVKVLNGLIMLHA
ncbi:UNVERIFIED_CONTAM: Importin subunit beta-1 [Sesamum angustifolium]|uniref:Importin subunit beta-1 n=1 Tax=Sesamum angustifolium TaxID=2727405 RepID=A0AAW2LHP0_9LAMI